MDKLSAPHLKYRLIATRDDGTRVAMFEAMTYGDAKTAREALIEGGVFPEVEIVEDSGAEIPVFRPQTGSGPAPQQS